MGVFQIVLVIVVFLMLVGLPVLLVVLAVRNREPIVPLGAMAAGLATVVERGETSLGGQVVRQVTLEFDDGRRERFMIASAVVPILNLGDRGRARWAGERLIGFQLTPALERRDAAPDDAS